MIDPIEVVLDDDDDSGDGVVDDDCDGVPDALAERRSAGVPLF